ncbi:MAG: M28 family peptidase [Paludibacteraceae bacterium]|nr:M28 family peptidase [Paludibacteraceae bacterium]
MKINKIIIVATLALGLPSCFSQEKKTEESAKTSSKKEIKIDFNADSAYSYIAKQCEFGPRVLESKAHDDCVEYMTSELRRHGADIVEVQKCDVVDWEKKTRKAENIIAHFNPSAKKRVILFSHWDSRPWADQDGNEATRRKPIDGANDGASGVGVILEIARQYKKTDMNVGLDIVFFDAEDLGEPTFITGGRGNNESWCLGSQYWAQNYKADSIAKPRFGILLDMVGDANAKFHIDLTSGRLASIAVTKIWQTAKNLGYDNIFEMRESGSIIDDHVYVNQYANIPTVDIIDFTAYRGFPDTWHTHQDVIGNINKGTLKAVGETIMTVLAKE